MTCAAYLEKFQNRIEVLEHCGGSVGSAPGLVKSVLINGNIEPGAATAEQLATARKMTQDAYLGVAFILGADRNRYGKLIEDLENDYTQGQDNYSQLLNAAYSWLTIRNQAARYSCIVGNGHDGIAFANIDGKHNKDGQKIDKSKITCYKCQKKGHDANECKNKRVPREDKEDEATLVTNAVTEEATATTDTANHVHFQDNVHFQFDHQEDVNFTFL